MRPYIFERIETLVFLGSILSLNFSSITSRESYDIEVEDTRIPGKTNLDNFYKQTKLHQ